MKTTAKTTTKTSRMIRKACSIALVLFCTMSLQARSVLVATLYHTANDSTSVYYGIEAFKKAYDASTHGDVITLSSGAFTACDITKEITIRGAGMEADTINHIAPTILLIDGEIEMWMLPYASPDPSPYQLSIEGIYFDGHIRVGRRGSNSVYDLVDAHFIKCRFFDIFSDLDGSDLINVSFTQCKVLSMHISGNASLYNCVVIPDRSQNRAYNSNYEFINCVVVGSFAGEAVNNSIFYNCVLYGTQSLSSTNVAYHCVGCYGGSLENTNLFSNLSEAMRETNHSFTSAEAIFKTFSGGSANVTDTETFELQDSIKTKYLGDDGTQVGIYGGPVPFSPKTTLPVVSRFKVASKSDESGKLKVEMQVNTPQ